MTDEQQPLDITNSNLSSDQTTNNNRIGKSPPIKKDRSKVPYTGNQSYTRNSNQTTSKSYNDDERSREKQNSGNGIIGKPKRKKRVWHSVPDYTKDPNAHPSSLEIIYDFLYENGYDKELKELSLDNEGSLKTFYQNVYNVLWDDEAFWDSMGVIPEPISKSKKLFLRKIALSTWEEQFNQQNKSVFDLLKSKR